MGLSTKTIPCQRHLFDIPSHVAYFNCAYLAPLLTGSLSAGQRGLARKSHPWEIGAEDFFNQSNEARSLFAPLINAQPADIAIIPAASYGLSLAAQNIPLSRGQRMVLLEEQFPSNVYPWMAAAKRTGAIIHTVARPADGNWTPAVLKAINNSTGLVTLPHCHWTDGSMVDLVAVGRHCHGLKIPLVLDVTQSLGVIPLSVAQIKPAFLVAAGYKWLLGPYGTAVMYVAPEYQKGDPLEYNWIGRERSEDFAGLVNYTPNLRNDASRFDVGERSNFTLLPVLIEALRQISQWGITHIEHTLGAYTQTLVERCKNLGFQTIEETHRAPHIAGLRYGGNLPEDVLQRLADRKVFVSKRGSALRISTHLHNNQEDQDRLIHSLETLLSGTPNLAKANG